MTTTRSIPDESEDDQGPTSEKASIRISANRFHKEKRPSPSRDGRNRNILKNNKTYWSSGVECEVNIPR